MTANVTDSVATPGASGTSYPLTVPGVPSFEKLWLALVAADSDSAATMASGGNNIWSKIGWGSNGTQGATLWASSCVGDGLDSGTVSGASKARVAHSFLLEGWGGTIASDIVLAHGTTNSLNPPNADMTSSADHLYIAAARNNNNNITADPAGYTNLLLSNYLGITYLRTAYKQATGSADNPAAFTSGATNAAHALTIGIRPGAAGLPRRSFLPSYARRRCRPLLVR